MSRQKPYGCEHCKRRFWTKEGRDHHCRDKNHSPLKSLDKPISTLQYLLWKCEEFDPDWNI